ncbi:MAG TPA: cytochrome c oxidase subunit 3 [Terriglobales bacterium]|jgi:heme/copper-type cytochrome/quinol oxidase subunit 3|nr:cytochrome c oxidase subunit 3 [Terriglobales bacterium]
MAQSSTARKIDQAPILKEVKRPAFGGGEPPAPPVRSNPPIASNAWLAVFIFLGAEAMFFAGLIGAFLVFRVGSVIWPPPFQPRLPLGVTGFNTVLLLASAVTMRLALARTRAGDGAKAVRFLMLTASMGATFLLIQGYEWIELIHFGLTVSSSVYGGLFYTIIGFHALHVFGALVWLGIVYAKARRGRYSRRDCVGLQICALYWVFVVALWPVLYGFVYVY